MASTPSITGIRRSISVTSGRWRSNASTASGAVGRLGDDAQVRFVVDDVGDAGPQQGVIVDDQHPGYARRSWRRLDRRLTGRHRPASGSRTTAAPRPARLRCRRRGAVTMVSEAPMRSARSCMLVMPKPLPRLSAANPRPSSATDRRKPTDRTPSALTAIDRAARVAHGVGQRLLGDADDLAFDAGVERRQLGHRDSHRQAGRAPGQRRSSARAPRRRSPARPAAGAALTPTGALRSCACARARRRCRGVAAPPPAAPCRRALRRLQLHEDRGEALRQRVVDVARDAVALLEHGLAALFDVALLEHAADGAAPAWPAGPSPRAGPAATRPRTRSRPGADSATQPRLPGRQHQRRDDRATRSRARG